MEALIKEQQIIFHAMQRLLPNYKKLGKANFSAVTAEGRLSSLRQMWNRAQELHLDLEVKATPKEHDDLDYFRNDEFLAAEEVFWTTHDFFVDVIDAARKREPACTTAPAAGTRQEGSRQVRLPKIALPKFSGSYIDWPSFADLFKALVLTNEELADVQKLFYLKDALEGPALSLIAQLPNTAANFLPALEALTKRFDNKRVIIGAHLTTFTSLPALSSDSVTELTRLRDTTNQAIAALANLGRPTGHWDDMLVHLLTQKFDRRLLTDWELLLGARTEPPTYAELDTFLEARIRSVEALEITSIVPSRERGKPPTVHTTATNAPAPPIDAKQRLWESMCLDVCRNLKSV